MKSNGKYILITAAHNEEKKIEATILSVIKQEIRPFAWVIVNDRSTDNTGQIITGYSSKYDFIKIINTGGEGGHDFSAKVNALQKAMQFIDGMDFDFAGILDADIRLDQNYYLSVIRKFHIDPDLGIAGGQIYEEIAGRLRKHNISLNTVSGGIQFFRKQCYVECCNFIPFKYGGEDAAVEIHARMKGWKVQTFPELKVIHEGCVGGASRNAAADRFRKGIMFYQLGYHPLFQLTRLIYRFRERPYFAGSFIELAGFIWAFIGNKKVQLSTDTVRFLHSEQLGRIKKIKLLR